MNAFKSIWVRQSDNRFALIFSVYLLIDGTVEESSADGEAGEPLPARRRFYPWPRWVQVHRTAFTLISAFT